NLVDDATGRTLARLGAEETIWAAAEVLRRWIEMYGVPLALYTDWKNVYVRVPNAKEEGTGAVPLTQFGRMCAALGIQIIAASSPRSGWCATRRGVFKWCGRATRRQLGARCWCERTPPARSRFAIGTG